MTFIKTTIGLLICLMANSYAYAYAFIKCPVYEPVVVKIITGYHPLNPIENGLTIGIVERSDYLNKEKKDVRVYYVRAYYQNDLDDLSGQQNLKLMRFAMAKKDRLYQLSGHRDNNEYPIISPAIAAYYNLCTHTFEYLRTK